MKNICLASIHTNDYMLPLAEITWDRNKKLYCEKHDYDTRLKVQTTPYSGYDKILFLDEIVQEKKHEWIFWCDCDTLVTNFNKKIEDIINLYPSYDFFLNVDWSNINGGVFLFKTSEKGLSYLNKIKEMMYKVSTRYKYGEEQTAMIKTYKNEEFKDIIKVLPQRIMNSYPYSDVYKQEKGFKDILCMDGDFQEGDFIIHIPGFGPDLFDQRMEHFRKYINYVTK